MNKIRRNIVWFVLASEVSHLFCCVLPTVAAFLSLAVGVGLLPTAFTALHDFIHGYEIPVILFSALMLGLGWWAYFLAKRTDCHSLGHDEHVCHKTTDRSKVFLWIGTALFFINLLIFIVLHAEVMSHPSHDATLQHHEHIESHEGHI